MAVQCNVSAIIHTSSINHNLNACAADKHSYNCLAICVQCGNQDTSITTPGEFAHTSSLYSVSAPSKTYIIRMLLFFISSFIYLYLKPFRHKHTNTFAFECSQSAEHEYKSNKGWLVNRKYKNVIWIVMWPNIYYIRRLNIRGQTSCLFRKLRYLVIWLLYSHSILIHFCYL